MGNMMGTLRDLPILVRMQLRAYLLQVWALEALTP